MSTQNATSDNALQEAIELAGGCAALARALSVGSLNVSRQRVHSWDQAPAEFCPSIERVTLGRVTCERLRPDVEWSVIRGRPARKQ